jgi:hypothetical protein
LFALVAASVLSSCGQTPSPDGFDQAGLPIGPVTVAFISARPDAHVNYPGAMVFKTTVHPEGPTQQTVDGTVGDPAYLTTYFVTQDSATAVRAWYMRYLPAEGYRCFPPAKPSYMYAIDSYSRGREQYWVGFVNRQLLFETYRIQAPAGQTVIETDYLIQPSSHFHEPVSGTCFFPLPSPYPS